MRLDKAADICALTEIRRPGNDCGVEEGKGEEEGQEVSNVSDCEMKEGKEEEGQEVSNMSDCEMKEGKRRGIVKENEKNST